MVNERGDVSEILSTLEKMDSVLNSWNWQTYGHVGRNIKKLQEKINREYEKGGDTIRQRELEVELHNLLENEELYYYGNKDPELFG